MSRHGHASIDRALYLPKAWTDDPARLAAAHVPPKMGFATKLRLALAMIERAVAAEVPFAPRLPSGSHFSEDGSAAGRWVAVDSVYGVGEIEMALRRVGKGYVLGVNGTHPFSSWGDKPASLPSSRPGAQPGPESRSWSGSKDTAGRSRTASRPPQNELGLDHNETRSWHGWYRHVSLVMQAFAMLAAIRCRANAPTPPKIPTRLTQRHQTSSAGRSEPRGFCRRLVSLGHAAMARVSSSA